VNFPEFLDVEDVIALHAVLLDEHGGQAGIRDRGLLESAVAMPAATFDGVFLHDDLFSMAAAYAFRSSVVASGMVTSLMSRRGLATVLRSLATK
jgi:prophage maintenance system killer protein